MRIAIYSDNFYPELSGITDTIMTIGTSLAKRGHEIAYYVPRYSEDNYHVVNQPQTLDMGPNISVFRMPSIPFHTGNRQGRFVLPVGSSFLALKKFNPDIIHFHIFGGAGIEGMLAAKIFKKPLVGTNHTPILEFMRYSPIKADWFRNVALHYDGWIYNRANFVSSPAQAIFDEMKYFNHTIPHQPVSNPIDTERFIPPKSKMAAKKKAGLPNFTLLFVSKVSYEKRIDLVIRALAIAKLKIPNITLAVVGQGEYGGELEKLARKVGVAENVKFLGFIPHEHLAEIYQASDLFAMMSRAETQSIAAMQALSTKVPVLAANAWGLKEYIIPGVGFLIEPEDVQTLAKKIVLLHDDAALRKKMGNAARKYVERLSIDTVTTLWEKLYQNTIDRYNERK